MIFQTNQIYIYDCLNALKQIPDNYIDLIVTDPPYEISRDTNYKYGNTDRKRHNFNFGDWDKIEDEYLKDVIIELFRVLKSGSAIYLFFDIYKINKITELFKEIGFNQVKVLTWLKTNPLPANCKITYVNATEFLVYAVKGKNATFNIDGMHRGCFEYQVCKGKERTEHPTQKPLDLIGEFIKISSNPGQLVLDPFIGSGTTAVAAKSLGRNYLGFDLSENYINIAIDRLANIKA